MTDYKDFLLRAKKKTYASANEHFKVESSRPSSTDFSYAESDLTYKDTYLGGKLFTGEEAIFDKAHAVWAMNYSGRVLSKNFSGDFFKKALQNPDREYPFRGQPFYRDGDYRYVMEAQGDFDWFSGKEEIYFKEELVYECLFHGGKVEK